MLGVGLGLTQPRGRAAGFSPVDLPNLVGWWDGSDTSTITESGGAVSQVDDKSGNGLHLLQAVAADQPTTGVATVNGLNTIYHAGDEFLQTAVSYNTVVGSGFTMVSMFEHLSNNFIMFGTDSVVRWAYPAQDGNTSTIISDGVNTRSLRVNGSLQTPSNRDDIFSIAAFQSNVATVRFNWANSETRGLAPMTYPPSSALQAEMNWCEAIIYDRQLSDDEVGQVEAYLAGKWGVTLA